MGLQYPPESIQWTAKHHISQIINYELGGKDVARKRGAMRHVLALIGIVSLAGLSAAGQSMPNNSLLLALPFASPFTPLEGSTSPITAPTGLPVDASLGAPAPVSRAAGTLSPANTFGLSLASSVEMDPDPQQVQGVFRKYSWQAYAGYTFFRFYETSHPTNQESQNGANWSIVYYWKDWLGIDGEMSATHGTQNHQDSWFLFGGGGPRFRWSGPRGVELWGHALFGRSHFTPQTAFGPQEAFAYELGGGVDIGGHYKRWAIRVSGDVIGSHYFTTYQFSPKISTGFVFKF
jgi:hypothetical protein